MDLTKAASSDQKRFMIAFLHRNYIKKTIKHDPDHVEFIVHIYKGNGTNDFVE